MQKNWFSLSLFFIVTLTSFICPSAAFPQGTNPGESAFALDPYPVWELYFVKNYGSSGDPFKVTSDKTTLLFLPKSENQAELRFTGEAISPNAIRIPFTVSIYTTSRDNATGLRAAIHVRLSENLRRSGYYLSYVQFPNFKIKYPGPGTKLAANWVGGIIFNDPLNINARSPDAAAWSSPNMGLIDPQGNLLYLSNTDTEGFYKTINIKGNTAENNIHYYYRQMPDSVNDIEYLSPYEFEFQVTKGDWVTVAEIYRSFLEKEAPWYQGPVGSKTNTMPQNVKDLMAFVTLQQVGETSVRGQGRTFALGQWLTYPIDLAGLAKEGKRYSDVFGKTLGVIYGHEWPAKFNCFYKDPSGGYFPGQPGFKEATAYAKSPLGANGDLFLVPYIQASAGFDHTADGSSNSYNVQVYNAKIMTESGAIQRFKEGTGCTNVSMSALDPWWANELPRLAKKFMTDFGAAGAYYDFWLTPGGNFNPQHLKVPLGYGKEFFQAKLNQARKLKTDAGQETIITMESLVGHVPGQLVSIQHVNPLINWTAPLHPNVTITDSTRISFPDRAYAELNVRAPVKKFDLGMTTWLETFSIFNSGQLFSAGSYIANFNLSPWVWGVDEGLPNRDYMKKVADIYRNKGMMHYRNGWLVRKPKVVATPEGDFSHFPKGPNVIPGLGLSSLVNYTKHVNLSLYPAGFYRAHPDSFNNDGKEHFAFAITNPWIGPCPYLVTNEGIVGNYQTTINLRDYPQLAGKDLKVGFLSSDPQLENNPQHTVTLNEITLSATLQPSVIHVWFIEGK